MNNSKLLWLKKGINWLSLLTAAVGTGGFAADYVSASVAVVIIGIAATIKPIASLLGDKWDDGLFNGSFKING